MQNSKALRAKAAALLSSLMLATAATQAQVIYSNYFIGKPATTIDQTPPDVAYTYGGCLGTARWNTATAPASTLMLQNGTLAVGQNSTLLPFTPEPNRVYHLIGTLSLPANSGNWIGLGFSPSNPVNGGAPTRLTDLGGSGWMLVRTTSGGPEQGFAGPGTGNQVFSSDIILAGTASTNVLEVDLDTTAPAWTVAFFINGVQQGSTFTYATNPTIGAVGVTQNGGTGAWLSWSLQAVLPQPQPVVLTQPASTNQYSGATASFSAQPQGQLPLFYQWQAAPAGSSTFTNVTDSANISGSTATTLALRNIPLANVNYRLVCTNSYGAVTSAVATLTALAQAPILSGPQPTLLTQPAGYPFTLSVSAIGSLPIAYQWQLNGANLSDGGRISGSQTSTLTIANAQPSDAGNYRLVAVNSAGPATSSATTVSIVPNVAFYDGSAWAKRGSAAMLGADLLQLTVDNTNQASSIFFDAPVSVTNFEVSFTYQNLDAGGDTGFAFVLQNDSRGLAALGGSGPLGYGTPNAITNSVALAFDITHFPARMALLTNGVVGTFVAPGTLDVSSGDPISITLLYSAGLLGVRLSNTVSTASFATNYALNIPLAVHANQASIGFTGGTTNFGANQQISAFFYGPIGGAPQILSDVPANLPRATGAALNLRPVVVGQQPIAYQWTYNGANLSDGGRVSGAHTAALTVSNLQLSDAGSYQLLVSNALGQNASSVASVTVANVTTLPNGLVVYYTDFTQNPAVALEGLAPDIAQSFAGGNAAGLWNNTSTNPSALLANGTPGTTTGDSQESALLPFVPAAGYLYRMTANISFPASSGNWVGMGFAQSNPNTVTNYGGRFGDNQVIGWSWMLIRTVNTVQGFAGPMTTTTLFNDAALAGNSTYTIRIDLDTTGANWTSAMYINGAQHGSTYSYPAGTPLISAAGLSMNMGTTFTAKNWLLEAAYVNGAPTISSVTRTAGGLAGAGAGGPPNGTFHVLAAPNLSLPLAQWSAVGSGSFDATGHFSFTNAISPGSAQSFYRLQVP